MADPETKSCTACGETKPRNEFPKTRTVCKDCKRAYERIKYRERMERDPEFRERKRANGRANYALIKADPAAARYYRRYRADWARTRYQSDRDYRTYTLEYQSSRRARKREEAVPCSATP